MKKTKSEAAKKAWELFTAKFNDQAEKYNALVTAQVAAATEILDLKTSFDEKSYKEGDAEGEAAKRVLDEKLIAQRNRNVEITALQEFISAIDPLEEMELKTPDIGTFLPGAVTKGALLSQPQYQMGGDLMGTGVVNSDLFGEIGERMFYAMQKCGITGGDSLKNLPPRMKDKDGFTAMWTYLAVAGKNDREREQAYKGMRLGGEHSIGGLKSEDVDTHRNAYKTAVKSMFTQHPLAGGDDPLNPDGVGEMYNPSGIFTGNTGGLCEFGIDNEVALLPYAPINFAECIPVRTVTKAYLLFIRQTRRVNNANSVAESIAAPPINFLNTKPESEFGFSQVKAYTLTFADTQVMSDEMVEDCGQIVSIVKDQLPQNVTQAFWNQVLNGTGNTVGSNPQLIGLLAQAGLSTRAHKSTALFNGNAMGAGISTDNPRDTIERAIFDLAAYGYQADCIILSYSDYVTMALMKDLNGNKLYTETELATIRGAKVTYDVRVPAGTAIVSEFRRSFQVLIRSALEFSLGFTDKQFIQDMITMRYRMRGGVKCTIPHAIIRVTALNT